MDQWDYYWYRREADRIAFERSFETETLPLELGQGLSKILPPKKMRTEPIEPTLVKLMTEGSLAVHLCISERHLRALRSRRLIPYIKLGRAIRYDPTAVAKALEKLTVQSIS